MTTKNKTAMEDLSTEMEMTADGRLLFNGEPVDDVFGGQDETGGFTPDVNLRGGIQTFC